MSATANAYGLKRLANFKRTQRDEEANAAIMYYQKPEAVESFLVKPGEFVKYCEKWLKDNVNEQDND